MSTSQKVLLDLHSLGANRKGVERVLREITPRLLGIDPHRYHLAVALPSVPDLYPDLDANQVTLVPRHPGSIWEQIELPRLATRLDVGAIYCHGECGPLWGPPFLLHLTEDPEIRWAREPHPTARERARRSYSRVFLNRSLRRARVVTSTAAVAEGLACSRGLALDSISVVPLGVDHARFRPKERDRSGEVAPPWLFMLASSDPRDNVPLVLEAFSVVLKQQAPSSAATGVRLVIAGHLGAESSRLRSIAEQLSIGDRVEFPGRVSDDELVGLYSGAVATIDASLDEGFGLQPLEALACGSLLISTGSPAVREVAGGAVVLWSELRIDDLARAMSEALRDRSLCNRARSTNREVAVRYSWDRTAFRLHELLEEAMGG